LDTAKDKVDASTKDGRISYTSSNIAFPVSLAHNGGFLDMGLPLEERGRDGRTSFSFLDVSKDVICFFGQIYAAYHWHDESEAVPPLVVVVGVGTRQRKG